MTDYTLKIGSYLSTISEYLGYNQQSSPNDTDSSSDTDELSLEDLLNDGIGTNSVSKATKEIQDNVSRENATQPNDKRESFSSDNGGEASTSSEGYISTQDKHPLRVDGISVEEILELRSCSTEGIDPDKVSIRPALSAQESYIHDESDTTDASNTAIISIEGRCQSCDTACSDEAICPYCRGKKKEVHFHDELNIVHTISIESGHFLTPLPKKESSKTDLIPQKHKSKEDSDKNREKKSKKSDKSQNKPDESKPNT